MLERRWHFIKCMKGGGVFADSISPLRFSNMDFGKKPGGFGGVLTCFDIFNF